MAIKSLKKIKSEIVCPPKVGDIVEGKIINRAKSALFLDLASKGIGVIYGREFAQAKDSLKDLQPGDTVMTKVIGLETEEGYRDLSFSEANQELAWQELAKMKESEEAIEVAIKSANKGGLICQIKGIAAFLPASQLAGDHYPKVRGADPAKIATELQKLVGQKIKVKVFDVDLREQKLIISEKATKKEKIEEELKSYQLNDVVSGEISGITNFGVFLRFGQGLEGLVHSSEISGDGREPLSGLKIGQQVKAKIIEIVNDRIYLSLKGIEPEATA